MANGQDGLAKLDAATFNSYLPEGFTPICLPERGLGASEPRGFDGKNQDRKKREEPPTPPPFCYKEVEDTFDKVLCKEFENNCTLTTKIFISRGKVKLYDPCLPALVRMYNAGLSFALLLFFLLGCKTLLEILPCPAAFQKSYKLNNRPQAGRIASFSYGRRPACSIVFFFRKPAVYCKFSPQLTRLCTKD
jgi:hypothetical protein